LLQASGVKVVVALGPNAELDLEAHGAESVLGLDHPAGAADPGGRLPLATGVPVFQER
jgi:hypothetical protein